MRVVFSASVFLLSLTANGLGAPALAQTSSSVSGSGGALALGVTAGTDGLGADLQYRLNPAVVIRGRVAWLSASHAIDSNDIHYAGHGKIATGGLFLDLHPWSNGFMVSGGVLGGTRRIRLDGTPTASVKINGTVYSPTQLGSVTGQARLSSAAPFLGLGFDNTFVSQSRIGVKVLAGVEFSGRPEVTLTPHGALATTPQLQTDIHTEEVQVQNDADFLRYYPAVSIGLTYRF